eukprot:14663032-Alexandrium_andersonii.AAC.1
MGFRIASPREPTRWGGNRCIDWAFFRFKYYSLEAKVCSDEERLSDHHLVALGVLPQGHAGGLAAPEAQPGYVWRWPHRVPSVVASVSEPGVEHAAWAEAVA